MYQDSRGMGDFSTASRLKVEHNGKKQGQKEEELLFAIPGGPGDSRPAGVGIDVEDGVNVFFENQAALQALFSLLLLVSALGAGEDPGCLKGF